MRHATYERFDPLLSDADAEAMLRLCERFGRKLKPGQVNGVYRIDPDGSVARILATPAVDMPNGIVATTREYAKGAGHFHTNEPGGQGPGMGDLDFEPVFRALKESGYQGWVSAEPFDYTPDSETVARTALETLRRAAAAAVGS